MAAILLIAAATRTERGRRAAESITTTVSNGVENVSKTTNNAVMGVVNKVGEAAENAVAKAIPEGLGEATRERFESWTKAPLNTVTKSIDFVQMSQMKIEWGLMSCCYSVAESVASVTNKATKKITRSSGEKENHSNESNAEEEQKEDEFLAF